MKARRVTVHGRVQGVGFRWHAQRRAQQLGVTGWVRNTDAGSVEAHLEGDAPAVEALLAWLAVGPSAARVTGIDEAPADLTEASTFEIAY